MRLLFSAINCSLDTSNGAAISIRTFLKFLSEAGVECRSFSASVYDQPATDDPIDNLAATGALPVHEPGLPQTLWLRADGDVHHYVELVQARVQPEFSLADEQTLYNRALRILDTYRPDVLLLFGARRYERSLLRKAQERGISTVFYLVHPGYRKIEDFQHADMIFTDTEATRDLFASRFGFDCRVIGKFIEPPPVPKDAPAREFITFINPTAEKGVTLLLRIIELAARTMPQAKFLIVESRAKLETAERRTGIDVSRYGNVTRLGLQRDMGRVYAATKVLLVPSLWHDSGPRVTVEALSQGIPVVGTNRGGIAELVGDAGILFDPPEPLVKDHWLVPPATEAIVWVEVLRQLFANTALYEKFQRAALARWKEHNPSSRLPGIVDDLERLIARTKSARAS